MPFAAELAVTASAAFAWVVEHAQPFASSAGSMLVTALWQGAVIVCVLEIAARLMPRISAAHRFALWTAGFVLALALPVIPLIAVSGNRGAALASASGDFAPSTHPLFQIDSRWGLAIAALWLVASFIRAAALAAHSLRLRRLWKAAEPVEITGSLSAHLSALRRGRVAICTTQLLDRPSVIGFLSPRILIPGWLLSRLTPGELEQIVLHEAEHLRRGDDWTNLLQKLSLVLFPLNPALAWIEHRLCREREMACDEGVVRITNAPRAYAACLASLAERRLERRAEALSLGAWHRRSELVTRVHQILLRKRTMSSTAAGTLLATLGSMLLAGSVEMSRIPQLVSFVPAHGTQATTPAHQAQLDALLARENADSKLKLPTSYRAVATKAVLPGRVSTASAHTRKRSATARPEPQNLPTSNALQNAAPQIAKSDQLGDSLIPAQPQPQQWVVVTEWREFSSASRIPQTVSDFEPENQPTPAPATTASSQTATQASSATGFATAPVQSANSQSQPASQTHHFTVTQLILRLVPANPNSNSTQPPIATVRDGWFVIQL
ncbi:M56 family metallopeptidase [Occallatibacter savannae]|uniref:M56 family metallopeptidase n=1 Tax=Occallatibacter savannae TaxID=1002691 RepID=UPI000D6876D2|nr:M56 family metallopeptidase [Occallatibacter savannae]